MTTREGKTVPMVLADDTDLQQGAVEKVHISNLPSTLYTARVWAALISQSGTSAPTVTVLRNDGNITLTPSRTGAGLYRLTGPAGTFPNAPAQTGVLMATPGDPTYVFAAAQNTAVTTRIDITTFLEAPAGTYTETDGLLNSTYIEVITYNPA